MDPPSQLAQPGDREKVNHLLMRSSMVSAVVLYCCSLRGELQRGRLKTSANPAHTCGNHFGLTVWFFLGQIDRFACSRKVVSYLGLNPTEHSSGGPPLQPCRLSFRFRHERGSYLLSRSRTASSRVCQPGTGSQCRSHHALPSWALLRDLPAWAGYKKLTLT